MRNVNFFVVPWMIAMALVACAAPSQTPAQTPAENTDGDSDAKAILAEQRARQLLARDLVVEFDDTEVISREPHTWPDSSLGCGQPGDMAAQVITSGYAMVIKTSHGNYRVHATDKYAVVCGPATQWRNASGPRANMPLRNINLQIERARTDLSQKLSASDADIKTVGFVADEWADSSMGCPAANESITSQVTKGYRITLEYQARAYTYHTDLVRVRACPAIETD